MLSESHGANYPEKPAIGAMARISWTLRFLKAFLLALFWRSRPQPDSNAVSRPSEALDSSKEILWGRRLGRAVRVVIALVLITALCWAIAVGIYESSIAERVGGKAPVTIFALIAFFAMLRELFLGGMELWSHICNDKPREVGREYVKVGTAILAVATVAVFFYRDPMAPSVSEVPDILSRPVFLKAANEPVQYFPFLFDLSDGPDKWLKGVGLNTQQLDDLSALAAALAGCVGDKAGQDVIVEVRGYSDLNAYIRTALITDETVKRQENERLNIQTANKRARELHTKLLATEAIRSAIDRHPSRVIVNDLEPWPEDDSTGMRESPRYLNVRPISETREVPNWDQGRFNRRAEIALLQAGTCERYYIPIREAHPKIASLR